MFKKTMILATLSLVLSVGSAYAQSPAQMVLNNGPSRIRLLDGTANMVWNNNSATATGSVIGGPGADHMEIFGYFFDVTNPGSLDVFVSDYDDAAGFVSFLGAYKHDGVGDWQIQRGNWAVGGERVGPNHPTNIFGVSITQFIPGAPNSGSSDPGMRTHFDIGRYLVIVTTGLIEPGSANLFRTANVDGERLSTGFATFDAIAHNLHPDGTVWEEIMLNQEAQRPNGVAHDLFIRLSPGSSAAIAPIPVPGAVWLMGSALIGFGTLARKKAISA